MPLLCKPSSSSIRPPVRSIRSGAAVQGKGRGAARASALAAIHAASGGGGGFGCLDGRSGTGGFAGATTGLVEAAALEGVGAAFEPRTEAVGFAVGALTEAPPVEERADAGLAAAGRADAGLAAALARADGKLADMCAFV